MVLPTDIAVEKMNKEKLNSNSKWKMEKKKKKEDGLLGLGFCEDLYISYMNL